jgi:hypothetical protein
LEGFRQTGLAENLLTGLVGLFLAAAVDPERRGRIVVVERTAVVVGVVVAAMTVALWVVAGGWRLSARSPRAERSRPSTDVMSASERTGKAGKEELLQLQSASV